MTTPHTLEHLDRSQLVAMIEWLAHELSLWIESESVESGRGFDKCRTPRQLIEDATAATQKEVQPDEESPMTDPEPILNDQINPAWWKLHYHEFEAPVEDHGTEETRP